MSYKTNNNNRGNRRNQQQRKNNDNLSVTDFDSLDDSNPVICNFRQYAAELDSKHDRHERIFKFSRDITIESKRIIFLLHTVDSK